MKTPAAGAELDAEVLPAWMDTAPAEADDESPERSVTEPLDAPIAAPEASTTSPEAPAPAALLDATVTDPDDCMPFPELTITAPPILLGAEAAPPEMIAAPPEAVPLPPWIRAAPPTTADPAETATSAPAADALEAPAAIITGPAWPVMLLPEEIEIAPDADWLGPLVS